MGFGDLFERQNLVDDRSQLTTLNQLAQVNKLPPVAFHHHPVKGQVALIERSHVALRTENCAEPSELASGPHAPFHGVASYSVQDNIDPVAVRHLERNLDGIVGLIVDGEVRSELLEEILVLRRCRREHTRSRRPLLSEPQRSRHLPLPHE